MAEVMVSIGGREYRLSCREGEQDKLLRLAERVDAKTNMARSAVGDTTEPRLLLFASLFLADEIEDMLNKAKTPGDNSKNPDGRASRAVTESTSSALPNPVLIERIDAISARLTKMAAGLAGTHGQTAQADEDTAR